MLTRPQNDVFIFAAKKCGVDADELVPRTVEDFRPAPAVSLRRAQMDLDHYDKMVRTAGAHGILQLLSCCCSEDIIWALY